MPTCRRADMEIWRRGELRNPYVDVWAQRSPLVRENAGGGCSWMRERSAKSSELRTDSILRLSYCLLQYKRPL
jgi:hypothetical protein